MTAIARLKPAPADPNLERLGALVAAVQARLNEPGASVFRDSRQLTWPETLALVHSIEHDEGWLLYGTRSEKLVLYLDAPQLFLRAYGTSVDVKPVTAWWSLTLCGAVVAAKVARAKRLGREVPPYTDAVLTDMRERQWFQWGRP